MRLLSTSTIANELLSTRTIAIKVAKHNNKGMRPLSKRTMANGATKEKNDGK